MASPSKAQLLTEVHSLLKKHYKLGPRGGELTVLEAVVYGICHEGTTREQANQALSRFKDEFFDWNEVRVSPLKEIETVLAGLPDAETRAMRIRRFLRQLFEKTYGFVFDGLHKKTLKDATKTLQQYEAPNDDYVLATVIQQALGGHAIPVDGPIRRGLERLGVADAKLSNASLRAVLERAVPKNRGAEFTDLMEELTHDTCVEGTPDCPHCDLKKICPAGQARLLADKAAAKAPKRAAAPAPAPHKPAKPTPKVAAKPKANSKPAKPAPKAAAKAKPAAKPAKTPAKPAAKPTKGKPHRGK
jgi:endonuclease-3